MGNDGSVAATVLFSLGPVSAAGVVGVAGGASTLGEVVGFAAGLGAGLAAVGLGWFAGVCAEPGALNASKAQQNNDTVMEDCKVATVANAKSKLPRALFALV